MLVCIVFSVGVIDLRECLIGSDVSSRIERIRFCESRCCWRRVVYFTMVVVSVAMCVVRVVIVEGREERDWMAWVS